MPIVAENKVVCFICILCVFVMCIFVLIFNNKDKIMTDFYLPPLWSKYPPYFLIFCNLERICLCNREKPISHQKKRTSACECVFNTCS